MLVDAHTHLLPRDYPADAPECFPRMQPVDGDTARTLLFGAMRFHELTQTSTPFSCASGPRYASHSQTMMAMSTGQGSGLTPSAEYHRYMIGRM